MSNNSALIKNMIRLYETVKSEKNKISNAICDLYIKELLLRVFSTKAVLLLQNDFQEQIADEAIKKAVQFIKSKLDQKINVPELAKMCNLGLTSFNTKFKKETGLPPIEFLMKERVKRSKILMQKKELSLKQIAYSCGFNSYEYFCSSFKKIEHKKPSEFRKEVA